MTTPHGWLERLLRWLHGWNPARDHADDYAPEVPRELDVLRARAKR